MAGKHDYPYRKGVDITAWVLQFIVCLILLGFSAYALWAYQQIDDEYGFSSNVDSIVSASAGVSIGITALTIVINIVEIILIARKNMPPWLYLTFGCIKTLVWLLVFIVEAIGHSILGVILALVVFITAAVQLGFGAAIVHKKRKGTLTSGNYARTANPAYNNNQLETGVTSTGYPAQSYGVPSSYNGGYSGASPTQPYAPTEYYKPQSPQPQQQPQQQHGHEQYGQQQDYSYPHNPNSYEMAGR